MTAAGRLKFQRKVAFRDQRQMLSGLELLNPLVPKGSPFDE